MSRKMRKVKNKATPRPSREAKSGKAALHERALSLLRECSEAKSIDDALRIITDQACVGVGGQGGSVWLRSSGDPTRIILRWTYRLDGPNIVGQSFYTNVADKKGYYDGLTGWVFARGEPLCLNDITDRKEVDRYKHLVWKDKYKGYETSRDKSKQRRFLAVPILSCRAKRQVIGVLRIGASKTTRPFGKTQMQLLQTYSGYISGLLTNYLKVEEERALIERLFALSGESDLYVVLDQTARTIPLVLDGSHCSIFLKQEDGTFCLEASSAPHMQESVRRRAGTDCLAYVPGTGKTGRVAATGQTVRESGNISSAAGKPPDLCECQPSAASFLATAIKEKNGTPIGVLRVVRDLGIAEGFDAEDAYFLESFAQKLHSCLAMQGYVAKGTCFVIMPFDDDLTAIYRTITKPTVEKFDFVCRREDEFGAVGPLTLGIVSHIANANFIIADITRSNPNVYYELGIAHTLEKTVILLSQTDAPSDIRFWKYIPYSDTAGKATQIEKDLAAAIQAGLGSGKIRGYRRELGGQESRRPDVNVADSR